MLRKEVRAGLSTDSGSNCDMDYEAAIGALRRGVVSDRVKSGGKELRAPQAFLRTTLPLPDYVLFRMSRTKRFSAHRPRIAADVSGIVSL